MSQTTMLHGTLAAYAFNHPSELRDENGTVCADLITINANSARVKVNGNASKMYKQGGNIRFNPCMDFLCCDAEGVDCIVDWVEDSELCVRFTTPLATGIHELQSCL